MANCQGCGQEGREILLGCWCDNCGGVVEGGKLFFRHVATVDGKGGRFPIVFDVSTADYAVAYPRKHSATVRCTHCGQQTPTDPTASRTAAELGMVVPKIHVTHGPLDAVLAVAQPLGRGDSLEPPELSAAPTATEEERALLGI